MKRNGSYFRYLFGVLLLVVGLFFEWGGQAEASYRHSDKVTIQTASKKKKNKNKKKKNQNNNQNNNQSNSQNNSARSDKEQKDLPDGTEELPEIDEDGEYTSKEDVALYLHTYGHLPDNYITKKEARELGWVSQEGNLWKVAPGKSIGGDYFGNYEEILPVVKGRSYYECDIDTDGHYRGAKRIIFSDDGWIYYTEDHYGTFEELYSGEE